MDISHWDAEIHSGIQNLPKIVIKPDRLTPFHGDHPCAYFCPKTQEHQSTCVDS